MDYADLKNKDPLTKRIISCCYKVHSELGPGFNEKIYHTALRLALEQEGLKYNTEKQFTVYYQEQKAGHLVADLVVEGKVIVEVKAIAGKMPEIFKYQALSYLKASNLRVGLLVNFGNKSCQVKRFVFNPANVERPV